jgi:hypothetical protein
MGTLSDIADAMQRRFYANPKLAESNKTPPQSPPSVPTPPPAPPTSGSAGGTGQPLAGAGARELGSRRAYLDYVEQATPTGEKVKNYGEWQASR